MKRIIWTGQYTNRRPFTGSDEFYRHTLVLPWPIARYDTSEGYPEAYFNCLVIVIRPWWLCRDMLTKEARDYTRHDRALTKALYALPEDADEDFDRIMRAMPTPPFPKAWES